MALSGRGTLEDCQKLRKVLAPHRPLGGGSGLVLYRLEAISGAAENAIPWISYNEKHIDP
eukprot:4845149-Amphidinium_carterae.1